ncbi:26S proteasome regulatory subunit [Babesia caballi]|uniref:26S proteasome regulatory subunit n=1 Tax=Babesia caballi TaxID=5871 RepID=A0AAV4LPF5_BABCB|nr:26S proteasome regulatory subunit [Babesia caballi]
MSTAELEQRVMTLQRAFAEAAADPRALTHCASLLEPLKQNLTLYQLAGAAVDDRFLSLSREVYEIGALVSLTLDDVSAFECFYSYLHPLYFDYTHLAERSARMDVILGLRLLHLLTENRIGDFYMLLELLPADMRFSQNIVYVVELERSMMEGNLARLIDVRQTAPCVHYQALADKLADTARNKIAASMEVAYESLGADAALRMLKLRDFTEPLGHVNVLVGAVQNVVEKLVAERLERLDPLLGVVPEEQHDELDRDRRRVPGEHPGEVGGPDVGERDVVVVGVHGVHLVQGGSAQHLNYLHQLVYRRVPREHGLAQKQLPDDTPDGPHVDRRGVLVRAQHELGRPVEPRTDIRHAPLPRHQLFGRAEVAQLELVRLEVHEQVVRLEVAVTDAPGMEVPQRPAKLEGIYLDERQRHLVVLFEVGPHDPMHRPRHELHDEVEEPLLFLVPDGLRVVIVEQIHDVGV